MVVVAPGTRFIKPETVALVGGNPPQGIKPRKLLMGRMNGRTWPDLPRRSICPDNRIAFFDFKLLGIEPRFANLHFARPWNGHGWSNERQRHDVFNAASQIRLFLFNFWLLLQFTLNRVFFLFQFLPGLNYFFFKLADGGFGIVTGRYRRAESPAVLLLVKSGFGFAKMLAGIIHKFADIFANVRAFGFGFRNLGFGFGNLFLG